MATLELTVQNVKCGGCASSIEEALKQISGVEKVDVDIATGGVSVEHNDSSLDSIGQKLAEIGFPIAS